MRIVHSQSGRAPKYHVTCLPSDRAPMLLLAYQQNADCMTSSGSFDNSWMGRRRILPSGSVNPSCSSCFIMATSGISCPLSSRYSVVTRKWSIFSGAYQVVPLCDLRAVSDFLPILILPNSTRRGDSTSARVALTSSFAKVILQLVSRPKEWPQSRIDGAA